MTTPQRLQRKRVKGWRLPENGRCVDRSTRWGNPFRQFGANEYLYCDASHRRTVLTPWVIFDHGQDIARNPVTPAMVVDHYRRWLLGEFNRGGIVRPCLFDTGDIVRELRGKDLYCFCPEGQACHGDVLLTLANAEGR
jgi:hypothetical protein